MNAVARPHERVPDLTQVQAELMRRDFTRFCKDAWPHIESEKLRWNWHLDCYCEHLAYVLQGDIRLLVINTPFRSSKSSVFSVLGPAWSWLEYPWMRWLTNSYAMDLSVRDTMKARWLIQSNWFQERWGDRFTFMADANEKSRYYNDKRGYRMAGATAAVTTGLGGHVRLLDDPHNLKTINSKTERESVIGWYDDVYSSRWERSADDPLILIGQRGHALDLFGHVLERNSGDPGMVHLIIPLEYKPGKSISLPTFKDPRKKKDELLDPVRYTPEGVKRMKRQMTKAAYQAQLQQDPKADGGHILKKADWKRWPHREPPTVDLVLQVYDTAFTEEESGYKETKKQSEPSYSARTGWGLFLHPNEFGELEENIILLEHWKARVSYPELRKEAKAAYRLFDPDLLLVEAKASGLSLIPDLRKLKMPVRAVKVSKDKVSRAHSASLMLEQGRVWYMDLAFAEEVRELCADFPQGVEDDTVDTVTMALNYLRARSRIGFTDERPELQEELEEEHDEGQRQSRRGYA